jgi:hypothetical protein
LRRRGSMVVSSRTAASSPCPPLRARVRGSAGQGAVPGNSTPSPCSPARCYPPRPSVGVLVGFGEQPAKASLLSLDVAGSEWLLRNLRALDPTFVRVVRRLSSSHTRTLAHRIGQHASTPTHGAIRRTAHCSPKCVLVKRTRFRICVARRLGSDGVRLPFHLPPCVRAFAPLASSLPTLRARCRHVVLVVCSRSIEDIVVCRCSHRPRALFRAVRVLFNIFVMVAHIN